MKLAARFCEDRRQRIALLKAGFDNFSAKPLGDFYRFGDAAAFGYKARDVRTSCQEAAILDPLYSQPEGNLVYFHDALLSFRSTLALCCHTWNCRI